MSIMSDRKRVICDRAGCGRIANLPVGLRSELSRDEREATDTIKDWLFVQNNEILRHFCPRCAGLQLSSLSHESGQLAEK